MPPPPEEHTNEAQEWSLTMTFQWLEQAAEFLWRMGAHKPKEEDPMCAEKRTDATWASETAAMPRQGLQGTGSVS